MFTDDPGHEEALTSAATEEVEPRLPPLTAAFEDVPAEHGGKGSEFSFEPGVQRGLRRAGWTTSSSGTRRCRRPTPG